MKIGGRFDGAIFADGLLCDLTGEKVKFVDEVDLFVVKRTLASEKFGVGKKV